MKNLGVVVPIVTPCSRGGEPDLDGVAAVARHMIDAGCHALFVAGSTGRGPWFSRRDRERICRAAVGSVQPGTPVFAGCMASGMQDMLDHAQAMAGVGARAAVLTAPGYFVYGQAEVEAIFLEFADRSPLPVLIYDIPDFTKAKLDGEMVRRLASHGNVMGFKDSSADAGRFKALLASVDRKDFAMLQGKENLLVDSLAAGASGFVVSLIHAAPSLFAQMYASVRAGNRERADALQTVATALLGLLRGCIERRPETSTLFHFFNHLLGRRGVCGNLLLEHEGDTPAWIRQAADDAMALADDALES